MIRLLLTFLKSWRGALLAVAAIAVIGNFLYISNLQSRVEQLSLDKAQVTRWYDESYEINMLNQEEIANLVRANENLSAAIRVSEDVRVDAVRAAAARELKTRLELDNTLDTLEELQNESPSCNEIMQMDISSICPLTVQRLLEHSAPNHED